MADLLGTNPPGGEIKGNNPGGQTQTPGIQVGSSDLLKKWQGWLRISKDDKQHKESEIKRGRELYSRKNDRKMDMAGDKDSRIMADPPNHAKNGINLIVDQVYERNPKVVAKARAPVFSMIPDPMTGQMMQVDVSEQRTSIIEEVINHEMNESSIKSEIKTCIRASHIAPEAWIQTGYQFDEDNQIDSIFFRYRSVKVIFADPRMLIYDGVVRRCRFIALQWEVTEEEAQEMGLDVQILRDSSCEKNPDQETKVYVVYHMWDKVTYQQGFITESGQQFPSQPGPWPWKIDGFPFEPMRFAENPDERWAKAPILEVEGIQTELDDQRETMNCHVVGNRPVKLYDASLDDTTINTLAERDRRAWIKVKGLNERPNPIKIFNDDPLDAEFYNHYERNKAEMAEILKYRPADLLQSTGVTATEAQDVARKGASQIGAKIDIVEDCFRRIIRKAKQIIEQTYTTDRMTEISGKDGNKFWVRWNGGILQDTDIDVEVGSSEKEDSEKRLQVALNMLGTMIKVPGMNVMELALDVLRKSDYRDVDKYKAPIPPSMPPQPGQPPQGQPEGVATSPQVSPEGLAGQINPMQ